MAFPVPSTILRAVRMTSWMVVANFLVLADYYADYYYLRAQWNQAGRTKLNFVCKRWRWWRMIFSLGSVEEEGECCMTVTITAYYCNRWIKRLVALLVK